MKVVARNGSREHASTKFRGQQKKVTVVTEKKVKELISSVKKQKSGNVSPFYHRLVTEFYYFWWRFYGGKHTMPVLCTFQSNWAKKKSWTLVILSLKIVTYLLCSVKSTLVILRTKVWNIEIGISDRWRYQSAISGISCQRYREF